MAQTHKATAQVRCWKEHECVCCGTAYRYLFQRKKTGQGQTASMARNAAAAAVQQALESQVELRPCPTCGHYGPDMIGSWRLHGHLIVLLAAVCCFALVFLIGGIPSPGNQALWWALGVAGLALLAHLVVACRPFNSNLEANRDFAGRLAEEGKLQVTKGPAEIPSETSILSSQHGTSAIFLGMVLAALVIPTAELVRLYEGWTWNPDWHPGVVGPGDEAWTRLSDSITSVKGLWQGKATALVLNAADVGLANPVLPARTSNQTWGDKISVGKRDSKTSSFRPWAAITVPQADGLKGKTLRVRINLSVTYPALLGDNQFDIQTKDLKHTAELVLAGPAAGGTFVRLWWTVGLGGALLVLLFGGCLALQAHLLRSRALPTRLSPYDESPDSVEESVPTELARAIPVEVRSASTDGGFSGDGYSIAELEQLVARSRLWLILFILMMPIGCVGPISLMAVIPGQGRRWASPSRPGSCASWDWAGRS